MTELRKKNYCGTCGNTGRTIQAVKIESGVTKETEGKIIKYREQRP
jgi:hypothetical protein